MTAIDRPKKYVLIVEDEEDIRLSISDFFELENEKDHPFHIISVLAVDGMDASAKLDNLNFDLVITDFQMPRVEGGKLIERLRLLSKTKDIPVILISGKVVEDQLLSYRNVRFFPKPFKMEELIDTAMLMLTPPKVQGKSPFDAQFVGAVVAQVKALLVSLEFSDIKMGAPKSVTQKGSLLGIVSTDIHIRTPYFKGSLCLGFDEHLFFRIMRTKFNQPRKDLEDGDQKFAAEIGKQILADINKSLPELDLEASLPAGYVGYKHWDWQRPGSVGMVIPFICKEGILFIEIIAAPRDN